jgi:hypothetical protein
MEAWIEDDGQRESIIDRIRETPILGKAGTAGDS